MPRELTNPVGGARGSPVEEWLKVYFDSTNYLSTRAAIFDFKEKKLNGDLVYTLRNIVDDYADAKLNSFDGVYNSSNGVNYSVMLLEPPLRYDVGAKSVKQDDDVIMYNMQRTGLHFGWDITLDSDYTRIQNCLFDAASVSAPKQKAIDNIDVALSVLRVHSYYYDNESSLRTLTETVFEMPQMRDTMQKYISSMILNRQFDSAQLDTMFNTVVNRNRKHSNDRLNPDSLMAFLVLMPIIRKHFNQSADPYTQAPIIYKAYKTAIASLPSVNDPHKRITAMGRIFGAVGKNTTGHTLRNLHTNNTNVRLRYFNDDCSWIEPSNHVRMKKMNDDRVRLVGINMDRTTMIKVCCPENGSILLINVIPLTSTKVRASISTSSNNQICLDVGETSCISVCDDNITVKYGNNDIWQIPHKTVFMVTFQNAALEIQKTNGTSFISKYNQDMCCICLDDLCNYRQRVLPCNHQVHTECLNQWQRQCHKYICPICKAPY